MQLQNVRIRGLLITNPLILISNEALSPPSTVLRRVSSFTAIWGEIDVGRSGKGKGFDKLILIPAGAACVTYSVLVIPSAVFCDILALFNVLARQQWKGAPLRNQNVASRFPQSRHERLKGEESATSSLLAPKIPFPFHPFEHCCNASVG